MDPVARVVVIETFLDDDIFLADDDRENTFEETLLLPARDADMDRTEAIIISIVRECNKKKGVVFCCRRCTTCNLARKV